MARPRKPTEEGAELRRVQMDMPPNAVARMHRLQRRMAATSYAETLRASMLVHEYVLDALKDGGTIVVRRNGTETVLGLVMEDIDRTDGPTAGTDAA